MKAAVENGRIVTIYKSLPNSLKTPTKHILGGANNLSKEELQEIGIYDDRFALFSKELDSKVEPVIDEEHDDWGWFEMNNLPSPIAPFVADGIGEIYAK